MSTSECFNVAVQLLRSNRSQPCVLLDPVTWILANVPKENAGRAMLIRVLERVEPATNASSVLNVLQRAVGLLPSSGREGLGRFVQMLSDWIYLARKWIASLRTAHSTVDELDTASRRRYALQIPCPENCCHAVITMCQKSFVDIMHANQVRADDSSVDSSVVRARNVRKRNFCVFYDMLCKAWPRRGGLCAYKGVVDRIRLSTFISLKDQVFVVEAFLMVMLRCHRGSALASADNGGGAIDRSMFLDAWLDRWTSGSVNPFVSVPCIQSADVAIWIHLYHCMCLIPAEQSWLRDWCGSDWRCPEMVAAVKLSYNTSLRAIPSRPCFRPPCSVLSSFYKLTRKASVTKSLSSEARVVSHTALRRIIERRYATTPFPRAPHPIRDANLMESIRCSAVGHVAVMTYLLEKRVLLLAFHDMVQSLRCVNCAVFVDESNLYGCAVGLLDRFYSPVIRYGRHVTVEDAFLDEARKICPLFLVFMCLASIAWEHAASAQFRPLPYLRARGNMCQVANVAEELDIPLNVARRKFDFVFCRSCNAIQSMTQRFHGSRYAKTLDFRRGSVSGIKGVRFDMKTGLVVCKRNTGRQADECNHEVPTVVPLTTNVVHLSKRIYSLCASYSCKLQMQIRPHASFLTEDGYLCRICSDIEYKKMASILSNSRSDAMAVASGDRAGSTRSRRKRRRLLKTD